MLGFFLGPTTLIAVNSDIRLALVGAGRWGRNYIRTIDAIEGVRLSHLVSRNPTSAELVGPDCKISTDWAEPIEENDFDGLVIATPPAAQTTIALEAMTANIPVLLEKPIALGVDEANLLLETAKNTNSLVKVDHTQLFSPAFRILKQMADNWTRLDRIESRSGNWGPFRKEIPVLWDWGAHDVAMILQLVGAMPKTVTAYQRDSYLIEDGRAESVIINLAWETGLSATIDLNNHRSEKVRRFEIKGGKKVLAYDDIAKDKITQSVDGGKSFIPIPFPFMFPLTVVVQEFTDAIRKKMITYSDLQLGAQVVTVLSQCDEVLKINRD